MKRYLAVLVAIVLSVSLAGCQTIRDLPETIRSGEEAEKNTAAMLSLTTRTEYDSQWGGNEGGADYYRTNEYLNLSELEDEPNLKAALVDFNESLRKEYDSQKSEMMEFVPLEEDVEGSADENEVSEENGEEPYDPSYYQNKLLVQRADRTVLSVLRETEGYYSGGMHPTTTYQAVTFDVKTGKRLMLSDVVNDIQKVQEELTLRLGNLYGDVLFEEWEDTLSALIKNEEITFVLGNQGLLFVFSPYELAPYAAGTLQVLFPYTGNEDIIKEHYASVLSDYVIALPGAGSTLADLNADGVSEEISVLPEKGEYDGYEDLTVYLDEKATVAEDYFYTYDSYLIKKGENTFLYVDTVSDNDYHTLYVFSAEQDEWKSVDTMGASFAGTFDEEDNFVQEVFNNPAAFRMSTKIDLMSTYFGTKNYRVGENGMPESEDEFFETDVAYTLKVAKPFSMEVLSDDMKPTGEKKEIPVGSELTILRSDGETLVDVKDQKGNFYRAEVYLDDSDYWQTIDGESIENLFEMTYFAG